MRRWRARGWSLLCVLALVCLVVACSKGRHQLRSTWRGHISARPGAAGVGAGRYDFVLSLTSFEDGRVRGTMKWPLQRDGVSGGGALVHVNTVSGTYGTRLVLIDNDGDVKDIHIDGDRMAGTDKGGTWDLEAAADPTAPFLTERTSAALEPPPAIAQRTYFLGSLLLLALFGAAHRLGSASDPAQWRGAVALAGIASTMLVIAIVVIVLHAKPRTLAATWHGVLEGAPSFDRSAAGVLCTKFDATIESFEDGHVVGHVEWPGCPGRNALHGEYGDRLLVEIESWGSGWISGSKLEAKTQKGWMLRATPDASAAVLREIRADSTSEIERRSIAPAALSLGALIALLIGAAWLRGSARWFRSDGLGSWSDGVVSQDRVTTASGDATYAAPSAADGPVLFRASKESTHSYRGALQPVDAIMPGAWFDVRSPHAARLARARIAAIVAIAGAAVAILLAR